MTGLDALCVGLLKRNVTHVFGLPGTQNAELYNVLPEHGIHTVLATTETSAAFMANGYARASDRIGVVATIPGPGFTMALAGIAEARLDSVPMLIIVGTPTSGRMGFAHQAIDQAAIAAPLVKSVIEVTEPRQVAAAVDHAVTVARCGEPGPVLLHVAPGAMGEGATTEGAAPSDSLGSASPLDLSSLAARIHSAERPLLFLGAGAANSTDLVRVLAERLRAPTFTTLTARGALPEDHPCALGFDADRGGIDDLNSLLDRSDLVLALGCKLSHNGTAGFGLRLPEDRLIHVNTDAEALGATYAAATLVEAPVAAIVDAALAHPERSCSLWTDGDLAKLRALMGAPRPARMPEPRMVGVRGGPPAFFEGLRAALPRDAIVVTDSGLHQVMTRRYLPVLRSRGLITPSDFQSMGFGLPAAIGASLACPPVPVVAVVGDGGFRMAAMDLLVAAREDLPLVVVVFNDGHLSLIRQQQLRDHGTTSAVSIRNPDFAALSEALGVSYRMIDGDPEGTIRAALAEKGPTLVELRLGDSWRGMRLRAKGAARHSIRKALGPSVVHGLKRLLRRG